MPSIQSLFRIANFVAVLFDDATALAPVHLQVAARFFDVLPPPGPSLPAGLPGGALLMRISKLGRRLPLADGSQAFGDALGVFEFRLPQRQVDFRAGTLEGVVTGLKDWARRRADAAAPLAPPHVDAFAAELSRTLASLATSAQPRQAVGETPTAAIDGGVDEPDELVSTWLKATLAACPEPGADTPAAAADWMQRLAGLLADELLHQETARDRLRQALALHALGGGTPGMPAVLVLAGAPGSGKSHVVDLIRRALHGVRPFMLLNMASYQHEREGFGLIGLRAGWGDACNGRLTGFVDQHPDAVLVFDHIDRAHPRTQQLLADLFLRGELDDEYGFGGARERGLPDRRSVSFRDTLLIFTTQLGESAWGRPGFDELLHRQPERALGRLREAVAGGRQPPATSDAAVIPLAPALADAVLLPFTPLPLPALVEITRRALAQQARQLRALTPRGLDDADLAWAMTLACGPEIDVTALRAGVVRRVLQPWMAHPGGALALSAGHAPIERLEVRLVGREHLDAVRRLPGDLLRRLMRRGERLELVIDAEERGATLEIRVAVKGLERVPLQGDHGHDGGLAIELPHTRFADIVGHERVKQRLHEVLGLLKAPAAGGRVEASALAGAAPRGMLLHGTPGNGKTLLAKALAAEAELPVIAVSGTQLLDVALIRQVFARARRYAPSLVFIDEIDALGRRGHDGHDAFVNQLLVEIDGFVESNDGGVFVVAATNDPGRVDTALLRAGRLEIHVEILPPDTAARAHFIARLQALGTRGPWNARRLVQRSAGLSGADMERLLRECAQASHRTGAPSTQSAVLERIACFRHGDRRGGRLSEQARVRTAWHEAGHAVLAHLLLPEMPVEQVTIASRLDKAGFVSFLRADADSVAVPLTGADVERRLCVALAGRLAERCAPGACDDDAGAALDLRNATGLAWKAITEWGLDEEFGWLSLPEIPLSAQGSLAEFAHRRTGHWLAQARNRTQALVQAHGDAIERVARRLLRDDTLDGHQLPALVRGHRGTGRA